MTLLKIIDEGWNKYAFLTDRLESMDDPAKPPITVYQQSVRQRGFQELRRGLSIEDQRILERLESLKKDDSEDLKSRRKSSDKIEDEIAQRLARLKGTMS